MFSLIVRDQAQADLFAAWDWYESQRVGLGEEFLLCVEEAFDRIKRYPLAHPEVHHRSRRALLRRFPYVVLYRVIGEIIYVVAVFHGFRDPESEEWKQRR
jgi:plasmid stabilization system protein ParE